jgi:hypothetical protein
MDTDREKKENLSISGLQASPKVTVVVVPDAFDASNGVKTPFGHRWGGEVFRLTAEHLAALQTGRTLAVDVQGEYVVFLTCAAVAKVHHLSTGTLSRHPKPPVKGRLKVEVSKAKLRSHRSVESDGGKGVGDGGQKE